MGSSAYAQLTYGYDLGGDNEGWRISEVDDCGGPTVTWHNPDVDFIEEIEQRLYEHGFDSGLIMSFGHIDFPSWLLAFDLAHASGGDSAPLRLTSLLEFPVTQGWDTKLYEALQALGITPLQEHPSWMLTCSYE